MFTLVYRKKIKTPTLDELATSFVIIVMLVLMARHSQCLASRCCQSRNTDLRE